MRIVEEMGPDFDPKEVLGVREGSKEGSQDDAENEKFGDWSIGEARSDHLVVSSGWTQARLGTLDCWTQLRVPGGRSCCLMSAPPGEVVPERKVDAARYEIRMPGFVPQLKGRNFRLGKALAEVNFELHFFLSFLVAHSSTFNEGFKYCRNRASHTLIIVLHTGMQFAGSRSKASLIYSTLPILILRE